MNSLFSYAVPERSTTSGWEDTFPHSSGLFPIAHILCLSEPPPHPHHFYFLFFVILTFSCNLNAARSVYPLVERLGTTGQKACISGEGGAFSRDLEVTMVFQLQRQCWRQQETPRPEMGAREAELEAL